ncbi:hypothetical protein BJX62DRAFT_109207 [Aspergillus germanicus]
MSLEIRTTTKPGAPPSSIVFSHNHSTLPKVEITPLGAGSTYKVSYRYEVKMAHTPSQAGPTPASAMPRAPPSTASKATRTSHEKHQPTPSRASDSASQSAKSGPPALNASPSPAPTVISDTKTKQRSVAPSVTTASRTNSPTIVSRAKSEVTRAATDISTSSCKNDSRSTITTSSISSGVRYPPVDDHDCLWCDCPKLPLPSGLVPMAPLNILPPGPADEYECVRVTQRRVYIKSRTVQDLSGPQWVHQVASWTESASRDQNNNLHFNRQGHNFEQIHRF